MPGIEPGAVLSLPHHLCPVILNDNKDAKSFIVLATGDSLILTSPTWRSLT